MQFLAMRYPEDWSDRGRGAAAQQDVEARPQEETKALASRMASRFGLLEWESREECETLIAGLLDEHQPQGPTEEHLVEELAGIHLRKGRLRRAEVASHRSALNDATKYGGKEVTAAALAHFGERKPDGAAAEALAANDDDTAEQIAVEEAAEGEVQAAVTILESKKGDRYERALAALGDKKEWWNTALERSEGDTDDDGEDLPRYKAKDSDLLTYLQEEVLPWYAKLILGLKSRPLIREQAFGKAFDAEDIERLTRIEGFLDRKFEKTLDRLLRLQELRRAKAG